MLDTKLSFEFSMTDIRRLTNPNKYTRKPKTNKWKQPDDTVFDILAEHLDQEFQTRISDFLNLFYYFIICYSKTSFKRYAYWENYKSIDKCGIVFSYNIANANESPEKLLRIQTIMNKYRVEFKTENNPKYFSSSKIFEMKQFINQSLEQFCNEIQEPVTCISTDISQKLARYKTIFDIEKRKIISKQKSPKLNYDVIDKLILEGKLDKLPE